MNGLDLKVRRITSHVQANEIAAITGWHPSKVTRLEQRMFVRPEDEAAYVAALERVVAERVTSATVTTEPAA